MQELPAPREAAFLGVVTTARGPPYGLRLEAAAPGSGRERPAGWIDEKALDADVSLHGGFGGVRGGRERLDHRAARGDRPRRFGRLSMPGPALGGRLIPG